MSVEISIHKGFKDILYDNSMVGILAAVFKNKPCEFDILFVENKWKLCHDFKILTKYNTDLPELLMLMKKFKTSFQQNIIIDIKWDYINNRNDDLSDAIQQLKGILEEYKHIPFWIQASNPKILESLQHHQFDSVWKLGLIIYNMGDFELYKKSIHYAMVSLPDFTLEEIQHMNKECLLVGYTCHNTEELSKYKHLFKYIKGVVCDVSL